MSIMWLYIFGIYLIISLAITIIVKISNKIHKKDEPFLESLKNSLAYILFLFVITSFIWIPALEQKSLPGSCEIENYQADPLDPPKPQETRSWDKYKQVLVKKHEEVIGVKSVCKTLLFMNKMEKVLVKPKPAEYTLETVENPDYKPLETPTWLNIPKTQNNRCPITTCCDGTCSSSRGRGTCSWHGGVCGY